MSTINIYLVRHGQTFFNLYRRFQGWCDIDLTTKGIADGHRAGKLLQNTKFDAAYSSDLARAVKTATYILEENKVTSIATPTQLPAFREQFFGTFEGILNEDATASIAQHANGVANDVTDFSQLVATIGTDATLDAIKAADPFHDAENAAEFWARMDKGFNQLRELHPEGANVLLVSHGATIRSLAGRYGSADLAAQAPENGSITKLIVTDDNIKVEYYSLTGELPA